MNVKIGMNASLFLMLTSCAALSPPPHETEITLKDALVDTVDSLGTMKARLAQKHQKLDTYVDEIQAEFYVKGSRDATAKIAGEVDLAPPGFAKTLSISPSYQNETTGERQSKITITFKSIYGLKGDALKRAKDCQGNPSCLGTQRKSDTLS
ncbi:MULTISPECIES: hypothetical protein [unclassified Rhizobium]|uniref:hypothetical protein n=1 Tax=unclassified Rhizobium TaxID=2613769 RepID=UPI001610C493|nr:MULTISPECIES: hypothetical protein [unclassified Rhizobium]MBB3385553.1 hypothetical protein [Rhizobium sp. BK098]MBB3617258.1 hypothetical protein [Rhizobium sp. BK609]MBB3682906.1 hypothetical protein [Rhizobium sp. BK612]